MTFWCIHVENNIKNIYACLKLKRRFSGFLTCFCGVGVDNVAVNVLTGSAIYLSASLNSPIYFQFTHIAVSVTMVYRRFRYYRILHDVL